MSSVEAKPLNRLHKGDANGKTPCNSNEWTVRTGKQGLYYLHLPSGLAFQTPGAAKVALSAFALSLNTCSTSKDAEEEDDARAEMLTIASCLDQVLAQLHKLLELLGRHKQATTAGQKKALQEMQPRIVDMYDVCSHVQVDKDKVMLQQEDTLLSRSTRIRCQLLLVNMRCVCSKATVQEQLHICISAALHVYSAARATADWSGQPCSVHAC